MNYYYFSYLRMIRDSHYAYADGSATEYPLTKMFEIPSLGTLLVCEPFRNSHHAGFVHQHNFLSCEARYLRSLNEELSTNTYLAQKVRLNGYQLVASSHSESARIMQIKISFKHILQGKFSGSRWNNGHYQYLNH